MAGPGCRLERVKKRSRHDSSGYVAAIFLSGPTIDFQARRGIMDGTESFGRISLFPGFCPWHLLSFSDLDFESVFGFGLRYCTTVNQTPVNRFSLRVGFRTGFQGSMDNGFSDFGALRFFRLFGLHYGFSGGLWINSVLRIGFGLVFQDLG